MVPARGALSRAVGRGRCALGITSDIGGGALRRWRIRFSTGASEIEVVEGIARAEAGRSACGSPKQRSGTPGWTLQVSQSIHTSKTGRKTMVLAKTTPQAARDSP